MSATRRQRDAAMTLRQRWLDMGIPSVVTAHEAHLLSD